MPAAKLLIALLLSGVLDLLEWRVHHPPYMPIIALIHFAVCLIAVFLVAFLWTRFVRPRRA